MSRDGDLLLTGRRWHLDYVVLKSHTVEMDGQQATVVDEFEIVRAWPHTERGCACGEEGR